MTLKNCEIWEFDNKRKSNPYEYKTGIWNLDKEKKIPVLCKRFLGTNHVLPVGHWYVEYGSTGTQLEVLAWRIYLKIYFARCCHNHPSILPSQKHLKIYSFMKF